MSRRRREQHDPMAGRWILDFAYSLGARHALDDSDAPRIFLAFVKEPGFKAAGRAAIHDQFQAGRRHELARGAYEVENAESLST